MNHATEYPGFHEDLRAVLGDLQRAGEWAALDVENGEAQGIASDLFAIKRWLEGNLETPLEDS